MNYTSFFIPERDRFFDDLVTMLVSLSSFMFTMHVSMASNKPMSFESRSKEELLSYILPIKLVEHPFSLGCRAGGHDFVVFPTMLLMAIALNGWPQHIEYMLVPHGKSQPDFRLSQSGVRNIVSHIVGASFVTYYSKCESVINKIYKAEKDKWPEPIRLAWILRNGFAHGGKVHLTDTRLRPVIWKIWTIDNSYNDRNCLFDEGMFGIGDIVALIQEVDGLVYNSVKKED